MRDSNEAFKEWFKGKTSHINKDGHIGIINSEVNIPINKNIPIKPKIAE